MCFCFNKKADISVLLLIHRTYEKKCQIHPKPKQFEAGSIFFSVN